MSKLDKRAISILVITILVLSFVLPLVSVSADVTNVPAGACTSVWTTDKAKVGIYSLHVEMPDAATPGARVDNAGVDIVAWLPDGITLGSLTEVNFWEYIVTPGDTVIEIGACLIVNIDINDDEVFDFTNDAQLVLECPYPSAPLVMDNIGTWDERDGFTDGYTGYDKGTGQRHLAGSDDGLPGRDLAWFTTSAYSSDEVLGVGVVVGWGYYGSYDGYFDDFTVNGVTYPLEIDLPGTDPFSIDYVTPGDVDYDDVLTVMGSGVTAGSEIKVFWDYASGTYAHLLNTTEGNPAGTFDCEVTVPSDIVGAHYLWVTDVATGATVKSDLITMVPRIKLSPSSGLVGDEITVKGYGFAAEKDVTVTFNFTIGSATELGIVETDELGYFTLDFDIPVAGYSETHEVYAVDELNNWDDEVLKVGTSITLDPEEGPSGTVVTISGRGWTYPGIITLTLGGKTVKTVDAKSIDVNTLGKFSAKVVIPSMASETDYDIIATEPGTTDTAKASFEVTGNSAIKLTPGYGPPGGTVEIKGYNFTQIADTEVVIDFGTEGSYVTYKTDSKGEFSETIRIPAIGYAIHTMTAREIDHELSAEKDFRIGIMIIILNPSYGPTGTLVSLTGIGFTADGTWNATMDGVAITDDAVSMEGVETISESIFIPTLPVGTYEITVLDIETEIDLIEMYHVTATTEAFADPASAPNEYRVLFEGKYFAQKAGADLEFILYNSTESWDISSDVYLYDPDETTTALKYTYDSAVLDSDGNFSAWWEVEEKDILSLGCYVVNVTDDEGLFAQINFCVCEERIYITPRKALFDRGDTVQFDVKNDFPYDKSYMKVYDPNDNLYWVTKTFEEIDEEWIKVATLYTVPYYAQTSGGNPMTLAQDAPLGPWFWAFYTVEDKQLVNGTFAVGPSSAAQVEEKLTEIWGSIEDLTTNIDSITDEIAGDIDALSGEIDDVVADVQDMVDDITADLAEELAGVAAATEDAVDELEESIGDIAASQNELASDLEDSLQTSIDAKEAAEAAQDSAQGLTTLVYGAIAASLIAALAAVVSLMQISKKIA